MLEELTGEGKTSSFSYKMRDVLTMYRGFLDYVEGTYITAEEILDLLAELADDSALLRGSTLVFDGFTGFTPNQNKLLTVLFPLVKDVLVTVSMDEREDFYAKPQMQDLFYMSRKMIRSLMEIARETGVCVKEPVVLSGGESKMPSAFSHCMTHGRNCVLRRERSDIWCGKNTTATGISRSYPGMTRPMETMRRRSLRSTGYRCLWIIRKTSCFIRFRSLSGRCLRS